jgi:ATP-dependent RNA helicase CshB
MDFLDLGVNIQLASALEGLGYKEPSPIQAKGIPYLNQRKSAVLKAPTGSGKTLSYLVPIFNDLNEDEYTEAVIIVPTAILVRQVEATVKQIAKAYKDVKTACLVAGEGEKDKIEAKIVIATPDQFLYKLNKMNLKYLKRLIIDEGDMILFGGFEEQLKQILSLDLKCAKDLYTASISEHLNTLVRRFIGADTLVDVTANEINSDNITHILVDIRHLDKTLALEHFLSFVHPYKTIVFVSKGEDLKKIDYKLKEDKIKHATIYGEMEKRDQQRAYRDFNEGREYLLLATDIAARGVDLKDVSDVISLDLPLDLTYYFHRAGRAGRFFKKGTSYVFYNNDDTSKAKELIQRGVHFSYISLKEDGIKKENTISDGSHHGKSNNIYLEKAIRYRLRKIKTKKVKPCYKKKVREAIQFVKQKHKDEVIKKNIEMRNEKEGTSYSFVSRRPYKGRSKKRG